MRDYLDISPGYLAIISSYLTKFPWNFPIFIIIRDYLDISPGYLDISPGYLAIISSY